MGEEIILTKDQKKIAAARLYLALNRTGIKVLLLFTIVAGAISFGAYFLNYIFEFPGIDLFLEVLVLVSLIGFLTYVFIFQFLPSVLKVNKPVDLAENFFDFMHPEVLASFQQIDLENPDLVALFKSLLSTRRVVFILNEAQVTMPILEGVITGLPQSIKSYLILKNILVDALNLAQKEGRFQITSADLFYGFLSISKNYENFLLKLELDISDFENIVYWSNSLFFEAENNKTITEKLKAIGPGLGSDWASGYTLNLDRFSFDIASGSNVFSAESREQEIIRIEDALTRGGMSNCILSGPLGSGKTTLLYGLAERIYWGKTTSELKFHRVLMLDVGAIISASRQPGDFQTLLTLCLNDAVRAGNVILVIDNIHNLFSGGKEGTTDATEIIAPYLESSGIKIVGITTDSNYQTYLAPKGIISANFTKIDVKPTDKNQTIKILEGIALKNQLRFGISTTYFALKEIYDAAKNFGSEKAFPAKAIDLFEQLCSGAKNSRIKVIDKESVFGLLERDLGLPVGVAKEEERAVLINLEQKIHERVIGQFEAVSAVAAAMKRARTKGAGGERPIGTFLFMGPTGVGKTELAKALCAEYFGDEGHLVRMDMNEFQDQSGIARFLGEKVPGKEELEGGEFVKRVKENPFSVILLDEIEKANPHILDLLLQALDEGYIVSGAGEKINLTNSIIIATSNACSLEISQGVLAGTVYEKLGGEILNLVQQKGIFKTEFLNRFDGVILFGPLTAKEIVQIAGLMFAKIQKDYAEKGYKIELAEGVLEALAEKGYEPELGARPMRRVFQDVLENYVADAMLHGSVKKGEKHIITLEMLGLDTLERIEETSLHNNNQ